MEEEEGACCSDVIGVAEAWTPKAEGRRLGLRRHRGSASWPESKRQLGNEQDCCRVNVSRLPVSHLLPDKGLLLRMHYSFVTYQSRVFPHGRMCSGTISYSQTRSASRILVGATSSAGSN